MLIAAFALAAQSPSRQLAWRRFVAAHLAVLAGVLFVLGGAAPTTSASLLGHVLLVAGIVEGAVLLGWRLTQLPRSQALEFLLVSPQEPSRVFLAEALVGLARLALTTLAGLPVLTLLVLSGTIAETAILPLLVMPFTWGAVTGLGLAAWAYEPLRVRRWGERAALLLVLAYLIVGVLGAEHLLSWAARLTGDSAWLVAIFKAGYDYNPFGVLQAWLVQGADATWERAAGVEMIGASLVGLLLLRASSRLLDHFHERHYTPRIDRSGTLRRRVDDRPLAWWAVKRVSQYSGRINLWLAAGVGLLYAAYTVAGPSWPTWLGRNVFLLFERVGGIPIVATGLVLLAAVPAAFQYGLWDASAQDRCRRLELLLLTRLGARDYWDAAAAAAWVRGRDYFLVALLLWGAAWVAGQATGPQVAAAVAAGVLLWCLYFAVGFLAFSRGAQANGLGMLLTIGLPLLAVALGPQMTALVPPGAVYTAGADGPALFWALGPIVCGMVVLGLARLGLTQCEAELRRWYDQHHGRQGAAG